MKRSVIALMMIPILLLMEGGALALALPTPTPAQRIGMEILEPAQTPESSDPSIIWLDDQRQPPPTIPPRKETPPGKDNIPWEIEPDDSGQPVKPKRARMQKMEGTYTVIVNDTKQAPQIEGKVSYAGGSLESAYGFIVSLAIEGKSVVEAYVLLLTSMEFKKGTEIASDDSYYIEMNGNGYKAVISYVDSEKNCTLMLSN